LQALSEQSVPPETYEVLVVDDGSNDDTAQVAGQYPHRVLQQAHAGPASARDLGAQAAVGKYLLFTDADCVPIRTWIEEVTRPLEADCRVAGVKGVYRTTQTSLIARLAQLEFEEKYARLRHQRFIDFVDTGSAAFRREAFWQGGAFDPAFPVASNEDTQLSFNLVAQGWRLVFAERAAVYHRHAESLGRYLRRKWRHGYWRVRVYRRHPGKVLGDSYTPLSMQLQMLGAALTVVLALLPRLHRFAPIGAELFIFGSLPFVRRALPSGPDIAAAVPLVLFLRALALWTGLIQGAFTELLAGHFRCRELRGAGSGSCKPRPGRSSAR